jgi:hypothetical protein
MLRVVSDVERVMVVCKETQNFVPTGFRMTADALFQGQFPESSFVCICCGQTHHWKQSDAVLIALQDE